MVRINAPDLVRRIRERYGVRGPEGIEALAPEIVPVAIVDLLEAESPSNQRHYGQGHYLGASAAEFSAIQLEMPAGTNRIAVIKSAFIIGTSGNRPLYGWGTSQLSTALASAENRDRRNLDYWYASALMRYQQAAGGAWGTFLSRSHVTNGAQFIGDLNIVLVPGTWFTFRSDVVEQALGVQLEWYEMVYEG